MSHHTLLNRFQQASSTLYILALGTTLLLFLGGCRTKSSQLKELEHLAATIQPTTGHEVSRSLQDKGTGFTGPRYAEIYIEFEPNNDDSKEGVYNEIVNILKENNWEGSACDGCRTASFSASLQQDNYPIEITARVRVHADKDLVSIRMVHPKP